MSDTMMQEILKRLDALAEKFGAGGAMAWETMMRQAIWIDGVLTVALGLALLLPIYPLVRAVLRMSKKAVDEYGLDPGYALGIFFSGGSALGFGIAGVVQLWSGVAHVVNPQYYALMDLAQMLTGK